MLYVAFRRTKNIERKQLYFLLKLSVFMLAMTSRLLASIASLPKSNNAIICQLRMYLSSLITTSGCRRLLLPSLKLSPPEASDFDPHLQFVPYRQSLYKLRTFGAGLLFEIMSQNNACQEKRK